MKIQAPVGQGLGVQKFSLKSGPGGGLEFAGNAQTPLQAAALAAEPVEAPAETPAPPQRPVAPQTPFARLYPGVDPSKVNLVVDEKSGKLRVAPIEAPAEAPAEIPAATAAPVITAPAEPDPIAQLRAEIAQQNQVQAAMLQALITGRPIAEILSGQPAAPAAPDYSRFDLEDEEGRAAYAQAVRADAVAAAKAEMQAEMRNHMPSIRDTQRQGERLAVQAEHGTDPNYSQKVALTERLMGNNPNISFKATYDLITQIQSGLSPVSGSTPGRPAGPVLTPAQAELKAAQAARYQSNNGGRATGPPEPPPEIAKNFKKLAHWVAQQQALGNLH